MSDNWRMAFMFDAIGGEANDLERSLIEASPAIAQLAGMADLRIGIVDRSPAYGSGNESDYDSTVGRTVDAAIELTFAALALNDVMAVAPALAARIGEMVAPGSMQVMAGPMFAMVPQRDGDTILSLAFSRYPGTTSEQFRDWWRLQHAPLAISVLGPGLLAYDQVHIDRAITEALSAACGLVAYPYDAYDNLTWASPEDFLASITDAEGMAQLYKDEAGRIDNDSRRHAMLRRIAA